MPFDIIRRRKIAECLSHVIEETEDFSLESQWDQEWTQNILSQALFKLRVEMKPSLYQTSFEFFSVVAKGIYNRIVPTAIFCTSLPLPVKVR